MLLEIKTFPNKVLKKVSVEVEEVTPELKELASNMLETMYENKGVGLAAPQVGVSKRLIVLDCSENRDEPIVLFNPEIVKGIGKTIGTEGCLSIPDIEAKVQRFEKINIKGLNENGEETSYDAEELLSTCFQHEIDHLNGVLFVDKLSPVQKLKVKKLLAEMEAQAIQ
ncbi:MAG: peptide deformylase [Planctomycetota bacterium]|nr:MAG: peptide deformylase [Planctomycetota bacterium]